MKQRFRMFRRGNYFWSHGMEAAKHAMRLPNHRDEHSISENTDAAINFTSQSHDLLDGDD
jgi:hypothetical protein